MVECPYFKRAPEQDHLIRELVYRACGDPKRDEFPGAHPVNLTKGNLHLLGQRPYLCCEKTDGTRYLCVVLGGFFYFLNRKNEVYLGTRCPHVETPLIVCDGELVLDQKDGQETWYFLIFDGLGVGFEKWSPQEKTFLCRLFGVWQALKPSLPASYEGIRFACKDFFAAHDAGTVLQISQTLDHASDGLIFQPLLGGYEFGVGADKTLLKWKPKSLQTVDFQLNHENGQYQLWTTKGDGPAMHHLTPVLAKKPPLYGGPNMEAQNPKMWHKAIVECRFDPKYGSSGGWVFYRVRTDKGRPNDVLILKKTVEDLKNELSIELVEQTVKRSLTLSKDPDS